VRFRPEHVNRMWERRTRTNVN